MKISRLNICILSVVASAIAIFIVGCIGKNKIKTIKRIAPSVVVISAVPSPISSSIEAIGTTVSNESVDISSNVTQKVVEVNFSDGDFVKKGQLLVQLNIDKKSAEKRQAEINLQEQERETNRLLLLKKKNVIPSKDYDIQHTKFLLAQSNLDAINAEIQESSIVAPFDGIVGFRNISVGALLSAGVVITTIDDIEKLKVDFSVPEKYLVALKRGMKFSAISAAYSDHVFQGEVSVISSRVSQVSRNFSVRGVIDNSDHMLRPGMMLRVTMQLDDRVAIQVPERSLLNIGEKHYVFTAVDGKAVRKYVAIGERINGFVEIVGGLTDGDQIIVDGLSKLSDNDAIDIVRDDTSEVFRKLNDSIPSSLGEK